MNKPPTTSTGDSSRQKIGVALALTVAVAFALANSAASLAYEGGSNPLTVAAVRFVLPAAALIIWLRASGAPLGLPRRDTAIAAALGVVAAAYNWALLGAIATIPLALAILVFYLFPLVATVILAVFGWEKLGWRTIVAIVLAFAGLALALDPRGGNLDVTGVALAFAAALGLGTVTAVSSRVIRAGDSRPVTLVMAAVAGCLLIVLCVAHGDFVLPHTERGWIGFIGTAVFYAFAMISFFVAISMIGPVRLALLSYAEPVIASALGFFVLGQALTPLQIGGIAIVIVALIGATLLRPGGKAGEG